MLHLAAVLRNVSLGGDVQSRAPWLPAKLGLLYAQLGTESREVHLNLVKSLSLSLPNWFLQPPQLGVKEGRGAAWP